MDVSTGTSFMEDGVETYTFRLGIGGVMSIAELSKRSTFAVNTFVAGLYMYINRPEADDIISTVIQPTAVPEVYEVTIEIARGHYTIGAFCKRHREHKVEITNTTLVCSNCGESQNLRPDAFPKSTLRWLNFNSTKDL